MDNQQVRWVTVVNFPRYMISDNGQILDKGGKSGFRTEYPKCRITFSENNSGYLSAPFGESVHVTVARHFLSDYDPSLQVNHKDGNKKNNQVSNLEMVTRSENMTHAVYTLMNPKLSGEGCYHSVLNERLAQEIWDLLQTGLGSHRVAKQLGLNRSTVENIRVRKKWGNLRFS